MATYQLVGYNWDHWSNKQVSKVTKSEINHVSIRINPCGEPARELYVSAFKSDTYVPTAVVERLNGPAVWKSHDYPISHNQLMDLKADAMWWKKNQPGSIWRGAYYHYLGRHIGGKMPDTCTSMCNRHLRRMGVHVKEEFYPNRLIQEFIMEVY